MNKLIKKWFYSKSAKSASDFQLDAAVFITRNPLEFMALLRECRSRFGAVDTGVSWLPDNQRRSRLYNVSHGWN
ncbi:hypothetical protein ORI99_00020 [Alishewanella sp. SMS9]|nr:hypothetical protein [Alishewanella sp. SMS9]